MLQGKLSLQSTGVPDSAAAHRVNQEEQADQPLS